MATSPVPDAEPLSVPDAELLSATASRPSSAPDGRPIAAPDAQPPAAPDSRLSSAPDARRPSAPDGHPPSARENRDPDEAIAIPDNMMIFRSEDGPVASSSVKTKMIRLTRSKVKLRRSTPAPTLKGNGRKRFTNSPAPEDKQLRKKLDFGENEDGRAGKRLSGEGIRCKANIFPADATHELEDQPHSTAESNISPNLNREIVLFQPSTTDEKEHRPNSGDPTGEGEVPAATPTVLQQVQGDVLSWSNSNIEKVADFGPLPKMEVETNVLLESGGLTNHMVDSHTTQVADHLLLETRKVVDLVSLANSDVAEELDARAAQPLLAGGWMAGEHSKAGSSAFVTWKPNQEGPIASETDVNMIEIAMSSPTPGTLSRDSAVHPTQQVLADGPRVHAEDATEAGSKCGTTNVDGPMDSMDIVEGTKDGGSGGWSSSINQAPTLPSSTSNYVAPLDEFPPLEKGHILKIRERFENGPRRQPAGVRGTKKGSGHGAGPGPETLEVAIIPGSPAGAAGPGGPNTHTSTAPPPSGTAQNGNPHTTHADQTGYTGPDASAGTNRPTHEGGSAQGGHAQGKRTMADLFRKRMEAATPQVFVPEAITNIGFASTSNGLPSIYFSGAEIQKLADNVGHAIVGKFSHSIPNSMQIQRALDNIKFKSGFSWKYINAKHIFVQFEDMSDYARLLCGPKGTPVWYVDRHPMRVFKWTPDFDAYCESPIAPIWCNLIGLPIHLFDQSALFAIGKLLGNPIQVDKATADRSRLSFARICVEIDITKPPPEEIIIDICGREMVQQIRWGKIPNYCQECKHVGHSSEVCYAAGKMERPERRNYSAAVPRQNQQSGGGSRGNKEQVHHHQSDIEKGRLGKAKGKGNVTGDGGAGTSEVGVMVPSAADDSGTAWAGPDIMGGSHSTRRDKTRDRGDHGGGASSDGENVNLDPDGGAMFQGVGYVNHSRSFSAGGRGSNSRGRGGARGAGRFSSAGGRGLGNGGNYLSSNQFYSLMANGEFDVEGCGEEDVSALAVQPSPEIWTNEPHDGGGVIEGQAVILQGGPSTSSGMILSQ